ncbi:MAG TPA: SMI1/KNR4 family protein [Drouetiella sp.]
MKRYFLKKDPANKNDAASRSIFWEVSVEGSIMRERSGIEGMLGKESSSDWETHENGCIRSQQLIDAHLRDGYHEDRLPAIDLARFQTSLDGQTEEKFLQALSQIASDTSGNFYFEPPASRDDLDLLEIECDIILPRSLRMFLESYNGGFIWRANSSRMKIELGWARKGSPDLDEDALKKKAIYPILFGIDDIRRCCEWSRDYFWGPGVIPFCREHNGELLSVWSMREPELDSPVLDSFHETRVWDWEIIYPTFAHMLIDYVSGRYFELNQIDMPGDDDYLDEV